MTQVTKVEVRRMTTSRNDETKYEHFVVATNAQGKTMDFWMHYIPERALFEATEMANFFGIKVTPLIIDGVEIELDEISRFMLEDD